jgi:SnoaL-like polyketide cyclase
VTADANKALVRRYYEEMWNRWDLSLAEELLAPDLKFRGSLGTEAEGIRDFRRYARMVWLAFPDFHNEIADLVADGDRVVGMAATGRRVRYEGMGWFGIADGRIAEVWVMGDRIRLLEQIQGGEP